MNNVECSLNIYVRIVKMLKMLDMVAMVEMLAKLMVIVLTKLQRKPFFVLFVLFALYPLTGMYICIIHDDNNGNDDFNGNDNDSDNPITGMYNIAFFAIDLFEKLGIGNEQAVAVSSAFSSFFGEGGSGYIFFVFFLVWRGCGHLFFQVSSALARALGTCFSSLLIHRQDCERESC